MRLDHSAASNHHRNILRDPIRMISIHTLDPSHIMMASIKLCSWLALCPSHHDSEEATLQLASCECQSMRLVSKKRRTPVEPNAPLSSPAALPILNLCILVLKAVFKTNIHIFFSSKFVVSRSWTKKSMKNQQKNQTLS